MEISPELDSYPLCRFFLSGYLAKKQDHGNFPPDDPGKFQRYEKLFASALQALSLQPEALRRRPEFNFDSGDENNLESGIAILRIVVFLTEKNFLRIALIPSTSTTGADITCEGNGQKVCCEVKAITKTSSGRTGLFLEDQVYEKIRESIPKARRQLKATAAQLECQIVIAVFVMNWLLH